MRIADPWHPYPEGPDLSDLRRKAGETYASMSLASLFGGGIDGAPAAGLFRNMLRLTILGIEEYQEAFRKIVFAIEHSHTSSIVLASSNWEGCIEAIYRAVNMAESLRRQLGKWAPNDTNIRIEKRARFTDGELKPLKDLRDSCQHLDERLESYRPKPGETDRSYGIFLYSSADAVKFHGAEIRYEQVADLLTRLVALCEWLNMQNPGPGHPLADPARTTLVTFSDAGPYQKPFDGQVPDADAIEQDAAPDPTAENLCNYASS